LRGRDRMHGVPGRFEIYSCLACGSGTTFPPADASEIASYYPDAYAPYALPRGPLAIVMRGVQRARDRRFPLASLRQRPAGVLLDVGCGRGDLAAAWIEAGWRVIGVEPSQEAAAIAELRGVQARMGTLDTVPL